MKKQRQRKLSSSLYQEGLPLHFRGDPLLLNHLQLKLQTTLQLIKPHIISLPLKLFQAEKQDFVQPLAVMQTFDQMSRQSFLKNKSSIKEGIFYVYFPSNIRVDEKIFKIYDKNYESFIKDIPKAFRLNFAKFIIWQDNPNSENNIVNLQKHKLQELLSNSIKLTIEKKIETFSTQIASLQGLELNPKILKSLFVVRNKISSIYKQLKLPSNACEHLTCLYNDVLANSKRFYTPIATKQPLGQKVLFKSPFIIKNINTIFTYFDTKQNLLQILNFCFLKMFQIHLDLMQHLQAMKKFKQYLDFVLTNIWTSITSREQDVAKNIWIVETIDEGLKLLRSRPPPSIMNSQKEEAYSLLNVSICGQYRNAIQRIGVILYGLNTYCVFPRNLQYELSLCIKSMENKQLTEQEYPELKIVSKHHEINKMLFLSGQPINQTVEFILNNFNTYKLIYVRTLEIMQKTLSESPYKKVSWSMKLSVLKSTIIYFTIKDQKRMSISTLLQQDKIFSYESKKSVWQKLQILNKVYRLTLCKRYNIKMGVEDLLNIVLDDSIIHLEKIWRQLVGIISDLLFEYKVGESEQETERLNAIDYGEGEDEENITNRRRRKTTIHHKTKEIEVGTMKFISLMEGMDQIPEGPLLNKKDKLAQIDIKTRNNSTTKLSIQLSNRIISYAVALIQKSKQSQSSQNFQSSQTSHQVHKPLICLKFLITTLTNQQLTIPFQIIQTEDKFLEVEIKSKQVLLFKIQKLLIDIADCITLVYTMPINHEKAELYSGSKEEEGNFYANISPELKVNIVQLYEPLKQASQLQPQSKFRKQSTSSTTSRPNSQSSSPNSPYLIYKKLWAPLKFMFSFDRNNQIQIQKIQIQCQDEVYQKIFVGERQVNYKQEKSLRIVSTDEKNVFALIVFAKASEKSQTVKQANYLPSASKRHKQPLNILPKSFRSRADSVARSVTSNLTTGIDSNRIGIKLHIKHNCYQYQVSKQINYSKRPPFKVDYRYSQEFQEYTVKNLCEEELEVVSEGQNFQLSPYEEMKVFSPMIRICLKYEQEEDQFDGENGEEVNLMKLMRLDQQIDLKTMIKKQHLKPQKLSTIWLSLQGSSPRPQPQIYSIFTPIRILSQQSGYISILKWNPNDYQLIGKIQGMISYVEGDTTKINTDDGFKNKDFVQSAIIDDSCGKGLDLMFIPTKKGTISMPEISINSRKGVWKNGKTIRVG